MTIPKDAIKGRPTWAEIDLDALAHNFRLVRERIGKSVHVLAAVKANAYGHGAIECARRLEAEGVNWLGVALPEEGLELRAAGVNTPVLCLAGFWPGQETMCLQNRLTPVVYRLDMLPAFDRAAREAGVKADVHLKLDTGMGRLGVSCDEAESFLDALGSFPNLRVDGVMTHFAAADDLLHEDFTKQQLSRFNEAVESLRAHGYNPTYVHAANSAGTFAYQQSWGNMVRPGGVLYGFARDVLRADIKQPPLLPVMSLHSRITLLKEVARGESLGYGCTFTTARDSLIATVPIGYDDGYRRSLSNCGRVIIRGRFAPVVGRVSMDLTIVDVTDLPEVQLNDHVTLLGTEGESSISAEDMAATISTLSYEITCGISERVPRFYLSTKSSQI